MNLDLFRGYCIFPPVQDNEIPGGSLTRHVHEVTNPRFRPRDKVITSAGDGLPSSALDCTTAGTKERRPKHAALIAVAPFQMWIASTASQATRR